MSWHYSTDGRAVGPIEEADFAKLVESGVIRPGTMVWREGWPDWQPYSVATGAAPQPAPPPYIASTPVDPRKLDLRPMSIGDILDRTFRLYRANFMTFFLIMLMVDAVAYLVGLVWQLLFFAPILGLRGQSGPPEPGMIAGMVAGGVIMFIVSLVMKQIGIATLTTAVSTAFLGSEPRIGSSFAAIKGTLGRLFGTVLLSSLIIGAGLLLCIVPGIYFALSYLLVSEVVVLEGLKPMAALRRSRELMRVKTEKGFFNNNITKASIILLITFILSVAVSMLVGIPIGILQVTMRDPAAAMNPTSPLQLIQGVLTMLLQAAVTPVGLIAMILFYYDIRIRKEGFDLELLAASLARTATPQQ